MANKLLIQRISGRRIPKRFEVPAEVVDGLLPLLAGQVEVYDFSQSGGTETNTTPAKVRRLRLAVFNPQGMGRFIGCSFTIPHVKPTVQFNELVPLVVNKFYAHWNVNTKAQNVKLVYERLDLPTSNETNAG